MYGKFFLYCGLSAAEVADFAENCYDQWLKHIGVHTCEHDDKDIERCGCWECDECGQTKTCASCLIEQHQNNV